MNKPSTIIEAKDFLLSAGRVGTVAMLEHENAPLSDWQDWCQMEDDYSPAMLAAFTRLADAPDGSSVDVGDGTKLTHLYNL